MASNLDKFNNFATYGVQGGQVYEPDFLSPLKSGRDALVGLNAKSMLEAQGLDLSTQEGKDALFALATSNAERIATRFDDESRDFLNAYISSQQFQQQATTNLRMQQALNADAQRYGIESTLIGQSLDFARDQLQGAINTSLMQEQGRQNRLQSNTDALNAQNTARVQGFENRLADAQAQTAQLRFIGAQGNEQRLGLAEEGFQQRLGINEQGYQDRLQVAQQGFEQRQGIAAQGFEDRLGFAQQGFEQRQGIVQQGAEDRQLVAQQGFEQRKGVVQSGFEDRLLAAQQGFEQRRAITQQGYEDRLGMEEQGFQQGLAISRQGVEQRRGIAAEGFENRLGLNEQARLGDQSKDLDSNRSRSLAMRWGGDVFKTEASYRPEPVVDYGPGTEVSRFQNDVRGVTEASGRSDVQGITDPLSRSETQGPNAALGRSNVQGTTSVAGRSAVEGRTAATGRTSTVGTQDYGSVEARRSSLSDVQLADNSGAGQISASEREGVDSWLRGSQASVDEGLRRAGASSSYSDRFESASSSASSGNTAGTKTNSSSSGSSAAKPKTSSPPSNSSSGDSSWTPPSREQMLATRAKANAAGDKWKEFAASLQK